ncbi:MAG TPA: ATP-binding protein, partial [Kofleriaceae bacterium]|nr:ATP-binding protein [Kofleriaceae bacterium]
AVMRLQGVRLLLVEDHVDLAENVREILTHEGASMLHAATAREARDLMTQEFDVALVDVQLPDTSGHELLPELRRAGDGLAEVLLVTGNASLDSAIQAVHGKAYAYILKPFQIEDLLAHIERAARQARTSRESEKLSRELRTLVDTVQALLLVLDDQGRVVQVNGAVARATGMTESELLGRIWVSDFVIATDRAAVEEATKRLRAGELVHGHESRLRGKTGDGLPIERWVRWDSAPVRRPDGSTWIYSSGIEFTEVKELQRRATLAEKLAAVGTLSAGLAHEVRNPLNGAKLQLHVLQRRLERDPTTCNYADPLRLVHQEIDRLSGLVHDFLEFARPSHLALGAIDLRRVVADVLTMAHPEAEARGVELHADYPAEPLVIEADGAKISQVILNLVRNAIEAVLEGGRVWVTLRAAQPGAVLVVRDDGPGIKPEHLVRIFEPFFTTKDGGTGLGMAISHSLISQHGGQITARTDGGAVFEVTLPAQPPKA